LKILNKYNTSKLTRLETLKVKILKPKKKRKVIYQDIQQPIFILGSFAPNYKSKDYYLFILARILMGVGFGGRITQIIREKLHLAYFSYSLFHPKRIKGIAGIVAGVSEKKLDLAIKTSEDTMKKLSKGSIDKEELKRAKGFYEGLLIGNIESSNAICSFYAHQYLFQDKLRDIEDILKEVKSYNLKDLTRVYQELLDEELYLAIIKKK
jgi:predicted Zn-dependent peptidase